MKKENANQKLFETEKKPVVKPEIKDVFDEMTIFLKHKKKVEEQRRGKRKKRQGRI